MGLTCHHPPLPTKPGPDDNWIETTDPPGLPKYIDCRARAIYWSGSATGPAAVSRAIRIAVGVTEDEAAGKRNVTAKTKALAAAAIVIWNRKRAQARATPNK
jgi:hypothetical protein